MFAKSHVGDIANWNKNVPWLDETKTEPLKLYIKLCLYQETNM